MEAVDRLAAQLVFLAESEKLKAVLRRSRPMGLTRRENSAEHSWTLALMAVVLAEHANEAIELPRVLRMLLIHDLVEIDAGDTFCYDVAGNTTKAERERLAAERLFGLLPADQAAEFRELWEEFEASATPEAAFANAVDRTMPLMQNLSHEVTTWQEYGVSCEQVIARNGTIAAGSQAVWDHLASQLEEARRRGKFGEG